MPGWKVKTMANEEGIPAQNIREILGYLIGQRIVDVTQLDADEFVPGGDAEVRLHFEDGSTVTFYIGERGFMIEDGPETPTVPPAEGTGR